MELYSFFAREVKGHLYNGILVTTCVPLPNSDLTSKVPRHNRARSHIPIMPMTWGIPAPWPTHRWLIPWSRGENRGCSSCPKLNNSYCVLPIGRWESRLQTSRELSSVLSLCRKKLLQGRQELFSTEGKFGMLPNWLPSLDSNQG